MQKLNDGRAEKISPVLIFEGGMTNMADEEKITEEQAKELLQTMKAPDPQHIYENAEKNEEIMNSKSHFWVSFMKSMIRIAGCLVVCLNADDAILGTFASLWGIAEIFGVFEEVVDER